MSYFSIPLLSWLPKAEKNRIHDLYTWRHTGKFAVRVTTYDRVAKSWVNCDSATITMLDHPYSKATERGDQHRAIGSPHPYRAESANCAGGWWPFHLGHLAMASADCCSGAQSCRP